MNIQYPLLIDGGLSNELEKLGFSYHERLWTASVLKEDIEKAIAVHMAYLNAGARCITTFGYQASFRGLIASGYSRAEAEALILRSVEAAVIAKTRFYNKNPDTEPILIAASIGPYGAYLADGSEYKGRYHISTDELIHFHRDSITLLDQSNADILAFETIPDYEEAKVIAQLTRDCNKPAWISFSTRNEYEIADGTPIESCAELFSLHPSIFAIGVNCLPPDRVAPLISRLKSSCPDKKVIVYPNSGDLYDAQSKSWKSTIDHNSQISYMLRKWLEAGADIVGGCCQIGSDEISKMRVCIDQMKETG